MIKKLGQDGFHILPLILCLVVISAIGFVGFRVYQEQSSKKDEPVVWAFDEEKLAWYTKSGEAPDCKQPYVLDQSPVNLSEVMVIGMPGAYRGYSYKPHGGMRLKNPDSGVTEIKMPIDATLVGLTRYYEGNPAELQYLLTFESDCGIAFRFDHLYTLSPEFKAIADTTPEPKVNDTRTDPNVAFTRVKFQAGDVVATEVGFPQSKNFGFDFGVYDYRQSNQISQNQEWAAIHNQHQSLDWYGICWINSMPANDVTRAKELSLTVINPAKPNLISDYCSYAPNTTLDFNNGQPTDG